MRHIESKRSRISRVQARDLGYSLRRHFIDDFHFRHVSSLPSGALVLDLGGNRIGKRGLFNIERYDLKVVYVNLSSSKRPDVLGEAACLPFRDQGFDAVVCSEVLEHVPNPPRVVQEICRVLKKDGSVFICVPFLNRIHADPYDYGRYTDFYWQETLAGGGFADVSVEKQGLFWSVLVDMLRDLAYEKTSHNSAKRPWVTRLAAMVIGKAKMKAVDWDSRLDVGGNSSLNGFTTGFGITAKKA